jgi:hypothetical protein
MCDFIGVCNQHLIFFTDVSSSSQLIADKSTPGDSVSLEISSKDDGKVQR